MEIQPPPRPIYQNSFEKVGACRALGYLRGLLHAEPPSPNDLMLPGDNITYPRLEQLIRSAAPEIDSVLVHTPDGALVSPETAIFPN